VSATTGELRNEAYAVDEAVFEAPAVDLLVLLGAYASRDDAAATSRRSSLRLGARISNLGSSLGTAIAGTILVSQLASGNTSYVLAIVALAALALIGLAAAIFLPSNPVQQPIDLTATDAVDASAQHA
jgi:hypothetical protein